MSSRLRRTLSCILAGLLSISGFAIVTLDTTLLSDAAHAAEGEFTPAWSWGEGGLLGNGRNKGGTTITNTLCPWVSCDETVTSEPLPSQVLGLSNAKSLASGQAHTVAVTPDGLMYGWGSALSGANGSTTNTLMPTRLPLDNVVAVAAGGYTSLALKGDGTVWAWGSNYDGELGNGTSGGGQHTPTKVNLTGSYTAVAVNEGHALALRTDGTVWAWGNNTYGQAGTGSTRTARITTPVQVKNLASVKSIAAGGQHSMAVRSDGTVWTWGRNHEGQLGDGGTTDRSLPAVVPGLAAVVQLAGGFVNSVALDAAGAVWTWGDGGYGESGVPSPTLGYPPIESNTPTVVPSISGVRRIAKTRSHTLALKHDGTLWSWGHNAYGQLGVGDISHCIYPNYGQPIRCKNVPTQVPGVSFPADIAAGGSVSAITNGGSVVHPTGGPIGAGESAGGGSPSEFCVCWLPQYTQFPVSSAGGNFWHTFDDFDIPGRGVPLALSRSYNSTNAASDGPLGCGWTHSYGMRLEVGVDVVTVHEEAGSAVKFARNGSTWAAPPASARRLRRTRTRRGPSPERPRSSSTSTPAGG